jgi:phenylpropionate dioxygenase-like ring-hydroxylating dioxygenase large terminal subunit
MADGATAGLNPVPFKVTDPEYIPAQRYYDQAFFDLERERLWPHVWQMACRLEEIPEVGDWVEYKLLDKSVIVVRTKSGVKAFHNACRHRGVQLASGRGNCEIKGFVCPFHGWRFNIDGENTFVFDRYLFSEEKLAAAEINLKPCRHDEWAGCVFINFDDHAPSLRTSLGPVADRMDARRADKLRMEWWYATVLPTNWKLAMEAFMEGYHVMRTHPQLYAHRVPEMNPYGMDQDDRKPDRKTTVREFIDKSIEAMATNSEGMAGMMLQSEVAIARSLRDMELPDDLGQAAMTYYTRLKDEIYKDGLARGLPIFDLNKVDASQPFTPVEFMFPHYFLLPYFSAMSSYRIRPLTPETCYFEIWNLAPMADDDPRERIKAPIVLPYNSTEYPAIPQQDYSNLPLQQLGLHAGGFENMRLSNKKEGLISNYQRLIDGYLAGRNLELLASAAQIVNCGFDTPIKDIGF